MKLLGLRVLIPIAAALSGCAIQFSQTLPTQTCAKGDSYIVLGDASRVRLSIFKGEIGNQSWHCKGLINVANVWSANNFIVVKLHPRMGSQDYGIGQILPDGIGGKSFVVKKGASVPIYHAHPGKVTFVGSIRIFERDNRFGILPDPAITTDDARAYLSRAYPHLPRDFAVNDLKMVPASGGC